MIEKLNNPVWHSLSETHKDFALKFEDALFYMPDYCPFGALEFAGGNCTSIRKYAALVNNFFLVGENLENADGVMLSKELVGFQMVYDKTADVRDGQAVMQLNNGHAGELWELVNLVQPGYFKQKTILLGDYYGIFEDGLLVAAAGERMKMNDYTEVSAVVTRPGYTNRGLATQLVMHTVRKIIAENKTPYLHVSHDNHSAIKLYENLGFKTRKKISLWNYILSPANKI